MIVTTVTAEDFVNWLRKSDSYKNNFSVNGAYALFEYLDELSEDMGENIEFDPIAWCVEFTEYEDFEDFWGQHGNGEQFIEGEELAIDDNIRLYLDNNTSWREFDGGIIVQDF